MALHLFRDPAMKFLALFNDIDKKFDDIILETKFIPFNEKLKIISQGDYTITGLVTKNIALLKHMGEIRNQITHGLKLDGEHLIAPTSHALKQLKKLRQSILFPHLLSVFCNKKIISLYYTDMLDKAIPKLSKQQYIPVYDIDNTLAGIFSHKSLQKWIETKMPDKPDISRELRTVPMESFFQEVHGTQYIVVQETQTLYDIFRMRQLKDKKREVMCLFDDATSKITSIITINDLPEISQLCFG